MGAVRATGRLVGVAAACALTLLTMVGCAPGAGASTSKVSQLTVAQAQQAFATTWPEFDTAFVQGQLGVLARYSTPQLLEAASGATGCGCAWGLAPHSHIFFSVPIERTYPLSFLAQISSPAPRHSIYSPYVTMAVLTKSSATSRWLVAYLIRYAGDNRYLTSSVIEAAPKATFPITEVGAQLANFFTAMVTTGSPPPQDNWTPTGSTGQEINDYLDDKADIERLGDQQQTNFIGLDASPAFAYPDGDLTCANYQSISVVSAPADAPVVQPSDQITWNALAPGTYSSFTKVGMHQVCYAVNTRASATTDKVSPLSYFESVYQTTGTPVGG
jgi:hypothetical protein